MIRGLVQPVELRGGPTRVSSSAAPNKVIGVVCSGDLAVERDTIKDTIAKGFEQRPDAVWVCVEPKSDRITHDVMISLGIDPVVLPLNAWWRVQGTARDGSEVSYDGRRTWRDCEMLLCDELIVFQKRTGNSPWRDRNRKNLFLVELGQLPKSKARKTRKPVGV